MDTIKKSLRKSSSEAFSIKDINQIETGFSDNLVGDLDESLRMTIYKRKSSLGLKRILSVYKGLLYTISAALFFSTTYAIVKYLKTVNSAKVLWVNSVFNAIYSIPLLIFKNAYPLGPPPTRKIILIRSVVHALVMYMRYISLQYIPIAEASVIIFSYPIMVSVFARIVLKEPFGLLQAISAVLTVVGVALVSKLPLELQQTNHLSYITLSDRVYGALMAFGSTILGALNIICTRWLRETPFSVMLFNNGWIGVIVCLIIIFLFGQLPVIPCGEPSLLVVFCSLIEIVGLVLFYKGIQLEQAGIVSVVRAASHITFLFCWQLFFFKEIPDIWSISGVSIVIFCIICSSLSKYFDARKRRDFP